jgi:hypothetical protein
MSGRLTQGVRRGPTLTFEFDGASMSGFAGETIAAALLANGVAAFRRDRDGAPRGPYCNMGVCFECLVQVDGDGRPWVRACLEPLRCGMIVRSGGR